MVEVRFHGRGGQGAVTAANLLVEAAVLEGKYAQAFPHFGAERRGAPVVAFARISDRPIDRHSQVRSPDVAVVLDPVLFSLVDVTEGLKPGGVVVVNSPSRPRELKAGRVVCVDATGIARSLGLVVAGWPVVNTGILGALVKATGLVSLESVVKAIKSRWPGSLGEANAEAATRAYEEAREC
ncbi:2-oxoacid:acceptor oxidoreductase family protein [Stetteria hydrogenophila]